MPLILRPAPVALSNTIRCGTPPTCSNTSLSPWQTHSEVSPANSWQKPMLEKGKLNAKKCMRTRSPR